MPRRKKTSSLVLESAAARAAALESLGNDLDLGNDVTLAGYKALIADTKVKLASYNTLLSQVDEALNVFQASERKVRDISERMLSGIAGRYGKDSDEYEKAGGRRKSERRRRRTGTTAASTAT